MSTVLAVASSTLYLNIMTTNFVVPSKTRVDTFTDNASIGDVVHYVFDFTPWQDDNAAITAIQWTCEAGGVGISNQLNVAGIVSADITFSQSGKSLISILVTAGTYKKKVWLEVRAKDLQCDVDDYGIQA